MKMVAIPEERFLELIETEKSAESCKSCGALAQRERKIEVLIEDNKALREGSKVVVDGDLNRQLNLAVECIDQIANLYSNESNDNAVTKIIRSYRERLSAYVAGRGK